MPATLRNTTTTSDYKDCVLGGESTPYDRGALLIANNPASVMVLRGKDRASITQDEFEYVTPSLLPLVRGEREFLFGVRVKSAIAASPAQVSGYLVEPGVAGLGVGSAFTSSVAAGGGVTPGLSSVQVQKNGVLIGTEPILDLIDAGGFQWAIADDAANTRVTITPPRFLTGFINANGTIGGGTGFTCVRNAVGDYTITFNVAFATIPFIFLTPAQAIRWSTTQAQTVSAAQVQWFDATQVLADTAFAFFAVVRV